MSGLANLQFTNPLSHMDKANLEGMAGLLGMWANNEQRNAQVQQQQAIENNQYKNIQDAIAMRQAQALDNPADIDVLRRGKLGQALTQDATGRFDQGVLPGRIATTNAENKTKLSTAQLQDMVHQLDIAASALETPSPLGVNVIEDEGLRNKVAKEVQRSGRSPKEIVQAMSNSVKSALANSPHFMEQANLKAIEGTNQLNNTALHNQGAMERQGAADAAAMSRLNTEIGAGKYANRGKVGALTSIQQLIKTGRYESAAVGLHLMATMEEDPVKAAAYEKDAAKFEQMEKDKQAIKATGKPDIGGMGVPVVEAPPPRLGNTQVNKDSRPPLGSFDRKK